MPQRQQQRVITYIDGFNLYFGLRESRLRKYYWLHVCALAENLLDPHQRLVFTKYFTARISGARRGDPPKLADKLEASRKRQSDFLEALGSLPDFQMFEGHFMGKTITCHQCGGTWRTQEEKMTDVSIATEMLTDAFANNFDTALLISGDSDLVPPIQAVREFFPEKRIVVAFPPARYSMQLHRFAHADFIIGRRKLKQSQFPDEVVKPDGFTLKHPPEWR